MQTWRMARRALLERAWLRQLWSSKLSGSGRGPLEAFTVFDDTRVYVELLSAQVTVTAPARSCCTPAPSRSCPGSPSTATRHGRGSRMPSALCESSASSRKFLPWPALDRAASNYAPARLRIAGRGRRPAGEGGCGLQVTGAPAGRRGRLPLRGWPGRGVRAGLRL